MNAFLSKPKLVFFQYKYQDNLPEFLLIHKREHIQCLFKFFDVTVVTGDCDYQEICDRYQPDLALFESGVKDYLTHERPKIANVHTNPMVPKVGLFREDGFCHTRASFISDMEQLGINTFFAIAVTAADHIPQSAGSLFIWPNCVDPEIYRDYGEWKSIPVLFTGATFELYPWRQQIIKRVSSHYPSLICPHPGYQPRSAVAQFMVGERYARTINASSVVPACGTVVKEIVRKHFEVPACKACLVTEQSPTLEAAGFVDMTNCVFADANNVLDKLAFLFRNPDELEKVTQAGYELVHSRHTLKHRGQMLEWLKLHKSLKHDQQIIQPNPFEPLRVVPRHSQERAGSYITSGGLHLSLLSRGDENLFAGRYEDAELLYQKCLSYLPWMPEPKLKLALCSLYRGKPKSAILWIEEPLKFTLDQCQALDPDPVEWAVYIVSLLCQGDLNAAVKYAGEFQWLRHPELDRARWATGILNHERNANWIHCDDLNYRSSIHHLPSRTLREWIDQVYILLTACGQSDMANTLKKHAAPKPDAVQAGGNASQSKLGERGVTREPHMDRFARRRPNYRKILSAIGKRGASFLRSLERKCGYFLPYRLSESRNDELFEIIRQLGRDENVTTALIIGAVPGAYSTAALLTGLSENPNSALVFCIARSNVTSRWKYEERRGNSRVAWRDVAFSRESDNGRELQTVIAQLKEDNNIDVFDVLLISSSHMQKGGDGDGAVITSLCQARNVVFGRA